MDQKKRVGFMPCAKKDTERYRFDINKANKIFDLLSQEG
jgi:hypothetical protein